MNLSANGAAFIRGHEGFVPRFYLDVAQVGTIGIGFTWASSAFRLWWGKRRPGVKFGPGATITRAEADEVLKLLVAEEYGPAVEKHYAKTIAQHVYDQGCSTVFNCGAGTLGDLWARSAKLGRWKEAALALRSARVTATVNGVRKKVPGLIRRRAEEATLLEIGIYTGVTVVGVPALVDAMADGVLVRGERGPAVANLIADLHLLGFYDGVLDDLFGFGTEAAVLAFQRAHGLKADGWAGDKTLTAIWAAIAAQMPSPAPTVPVAIVPAPEPAPARPPPPVPAPEPSGGFWAELFRTLFNFRKKD